MLGSGGTATAWEAHDERVDEPCVVKLLPPEALALHRQERVALRLLDLPGVVRLRDEGADDERAWLVLERVDGVPFPGPLELREAMLAVAAVLLQLHALGVVHGDLKPEHLRVVEDRVVLLDFGYARWGPDASVGCSARWAAPEVLVGRAPTAASDVFALGAVLLDVAGVWEGRDTASLVEERVVRPGPAPILLDDAALAQCARLCLARDPEGRPTAAELVRRLCPTPPAPPPEGWTADTLAALVDGPERVVHLRSDGGALLWARTQGQPERVRDELRRWVASGARLRGDRVHLRRSVLERLAADDEEVDALGRALELDRRGRADEACQQLRAGLLAAGADVPALLDALVRIAIRSASGRLIQGALGEVERHATGGAGWRIAILRMASQVAAGQLEEATWALRSLDAPGDVRAVVAAQLVGRGADDPELAQLAAGAPGAWWNARGLAAYRRGDFAEALEAFREASRVADRQTVRLSAWCNAAAAALEVADPDAALSCAERARDQAAVLRNGRYELRAHALAHAARYRGARTSDPDPGLQALAVELGEPELEAWTALTDAALLWRSGKAAEAGAHALRAERAYRVCGAGAAADLASALAVAVDGGRSDALVRRAAEVPHPGLALQVAALAGARHDEVPVDRWLRALEGLPTSYRREVLSPRECLSRLAWSERTAAR